MAKAVTTITITLDGISEEDLKNINIDQYKEEVYNLIESESDEGAIITVDVEITEEGA